MTTKKSAPKSKKKIKVLDPEQLEKISGGAGQTTVDDCCYASTCTKTSTPAVARPRPASRK